MKRTGSFEGEGAVRVVEPGVETSLDAARMSACATM